MGHKMSGYYSYFTGEDGHITNRVTNPRRQRWRSQLVDGHAVELWQEGRKIAIFEPEQ